MKQLQKWFELMAGFSREVLAREEQARKIFAVSAPDPELFRKPACWRRQRRIGHSQA